MNDVKVDLKEARDRADMIAREGYPDTARVLRDAADEIERLRGHLAHADESAMKFEAAAAEALGLDDEAKETEWAEWQSEGRWR